ncbi:DUF6207 family protein [Streptomyces sp. Go40/10]|uniref:DUF6207 family protein n=1 Tax=Streptomyces sp. Go40/10 TaxID=2825844 RepID=UPI0021138B96|nr:DUF6207 family protein [Streptomyces sp. Go40/10]UFQ99861.1 DUF6207 family protein [Streptomyces sp. Go40/10]
MRHRRTAAQGALRLSAFCLRPCSHLLQGVQEAFALMWATTAVERPTRDARQPGVRLR